MMGGAMTGYSVCFTLGIESIKKMHNEKRNDSSDAKSFRRFYNKRNLECVSFCHDLAELLTMIHSFHLGRSI